MTDTVVFIDRTKATLMRRHGRGAEAFGEIILPTADRDQQARIVFGLIDLLAPEQTVETEPKTKKRDADKPKRGRKAGVPPKLSAANVTDDLWKAQAVDEESASTITELWQRVGGDLELDEFAKLIGSIASPSRHLLSWSYREIDGERQKMFWLHEQERVLRVRQTVQYAADVSDPTTRPGAEPAA